MRPARFAERKDAIDYRRESARIDDLRNLCKLRTVRLRANDRSPDAEFFGFLLRRRLDQRNENAALFQNRPGAFLSFVAKRVEDDVDFSRDVFESLLRVIDRFVDSELAQEILIFGRSG